MKREVEYVVRLGASDRYRHKHTVTRGRIIYFRVQYETMIEGIWHPVVRYDMSHGFAHRDLVDANGECLKTPLFMSDFNDVLTFAESDLKLNWEIYKERFLEDIYLDEKENDK